MAIPTTIESLSTTAASNGPSGSDQRTLADDGLRQAYAFIKQLVVQGSDIASSGTITPPSTASLFDITGTTTITTIASTNSWDGRVIYLQFDGALTLTHNGTSLILPGAANITTVAGDIAVFVQRGSGAWQCVNYLRKDGSSPGAGSFTTLTVSGNTTLGDAGTDTVTTNGNVTHNAPSSGNSVTTANVAGAYGFYNVVSLNGGLVQNAAENTSNTSGSDARHASIVAGSSAGDPYYLFTISGVRNWGIGIDNSDSDTFKIDSNGLLGTSSNWWNVTTDGRLYGIALHNNAGAVTGTTNQYIASGTYTPTGRTGTNTTVVTGDSSTKWMRVGNVVTVGGRASITTSASGTTGFSLSLPIASAMTANGNLSGSGKVVSDNAFNVFSDTTNDEIGFSGTMSGGAGTYSVDFIAIYTVL